MSMLVTSTFHSKNSSLNVDTSKALAEHKHLIVTIAITGAASAPQLARQSKIDNFKEPTTYLVAFVVVEMQIKSNKFINNDTGSVGARQK